MDRSRYGFVITSRSKVHSVVVVHVSEFHQGNHTSAYLTLMVVSVKKLGVVSLKQWYDELFEFYSHKNKKDIVTKTKRRKNRKLKISGVI